MNGRLWPLAAMLALVLAGCSGNDDPDSGTVVSTRTLTTVTKASIDQLAATNGLSALAGAASCDVEIRDVEYTTRGAAGLEATSTAAIMVPVGSAAPCTGERPVILYAHGTDTDKAGNLADIQNDSEAQLLMGAYAAQGFVVVAPNYLGYGRSSLDYHPFLHADVQARDMVDGLRAALSVLVSSPTRGVSTRLFVTGYSEGGHVAMATQRAIERDYPGEFTVRASGPMSGPYNLIKFGQVVNGPGPINAGATIFTPLLLTAYQRAYGNIYSQPSEVYQAPFDQTVPNLLPSLTPIEQLIAQGKLPADPTFTRLYGAGGLLTDSFRTDFNSNPNNGFRRALERNTLLGWTPKAPVAMCGGKDDPTVFFFNTVDAQADFAARGVSAQAFDLETRATLPSGATGDAIFAGFQAAKTGAGANAQAQYHGSLVPPFCAALVRGVFQQVLATLP